MAKISIIYHHFPHYRAPVLRALRESTSNDYSFFGSYEDIDGIKAFRGDDFVRIEPIKLVKSHSGKIDFCDFEAAVSPPFEASIIIGHIHMRGAWRALSAAKRNGLATAYWAHGWTKTEPWVKAKLRNFFFGRAEVVLTYGVKARQLAATSGFPVEKIKTIWNSLDWDSQSLIFDRLSIIPKCDLRKDIGMPVDVPVLLCISRVTNLCHYDWLINAADLLRRKHLQPVEIWMIGEGPALGSLVAHSAALGVPLHSLGAVYDEFSIAKQIMAADVVVSPGKVGLTAMHALAYGTPVITHSDYNRQMPEVEAIVDGHSGVFFEFGNVIDLAHAIQQAIDLTKDYKFRRRVCRDALIGKYTPRDQARLIDEAMSTILSHG